MSDFIGEGYAPFPNTHSDRQDVLSVVEWPDEKLDHKINEYGAFLQRDDLMERARRIGNEILDRLLFDMACRDNVYEITKLEDETCEEVI